MPNVYIDEYLYSYSITDASFDNCAPYFDMRIILFLFVEMKNADEP